MLRIFLYLVLLFVWSIPTNGQSSTIGLPFIKYYSSIEYGGGIQNWHISQDSRGIIYVANNFGLLEFDGSSWRIYPVANGVKVRHFNHGMDNQINIASQGEFGFFSPDHLGQLRYTSLSQNLPKAYQNFEETWKVFHLRGKEYFCTSTKIFVIDGPTIDVIEPNEMMENFFLINQHLYVNIPAKGLLLLENKNLKPVENGNQFINQEISSIIPLINNRIMVITKQNGIHILGTSGIEPWKQTYQALFAQSIINAAIRLNNGDFVFGTQNNGLFIFSPDGQQIRHLNKNYGLNNRTIICLFEDMQNNLWVGHNNGISYIELRQPFSFVNEFMGLPGTGYDGFQDDKMLYLGTDNGLFVSDISITDPSKNNFHLIEETEGQVYHINKHEKWMLLGHHNGGYVFEQNKLPEKTGETGTWMFLPLKTHPDYLIAGTYNGLDLYKKEQNSISYVRKLDGFYESCRILEQDDIGNIWMTHGYKGVFKFRLSNDLRSVQEIQFYGVDKGLPSHVLINVYRIRGDLFFTTEDGVYTYDNETDRFTKDPFFASFFESSSPLNVLAEDANQNIYYLGQREMGALMKDAAGAFHKETNLFNKINGMLNDDLQNISILPNNRILYGAKEGFIVYDPNVAIKTNYEFRILLRKITLTAPADSIIYYGNLSEVSGKSNTSLTNNQEFTFKNNSIKFEFSATYMDGLSKTSYQHYLEGFDQGWSEWSGKNEKEYTNLNEGKYTFRIRAENIYGQISNEVRYQFSILPPWYRSKLAYASYFFIFSISLSVLLIYISQKHKREKNMMMRDQEKELNKKDSELKNVKTESEREIEKLKTEKLKADINHKNKELATSTMHLINKNEFIAHVKQNLTSLVKKNPKDPLAGDLEKIMASIDQNISSDDDWQQFEIHFDQVHGNFSQRLKDKFPNLSPQERRLCAYLRMNMTTKEIANLLNITVRGAEISRYRLRKKLGLSRDTNLAEFILNF